MIAAARRGTEIYSKLIARAEATFAQNARLRADAADLRVQARALMFKYRGHRFIHLRGASDADVDHAAIGIRAKIDLGVLPLPPEAPEKCFVGKGTRRPCNGCDKIITPDEIEYEIDVIDGRTLRFHAKCLDAWHQARAERMAE